MKIKKARTAPSLCPSCGATLDGWSSAHGWTPRPGDLSFCAYCRALLVFGPGLRPRLATDAERAAVLADPGVRQQYLDLCLAADKGAFPIGDPGLGGGPRQ